ncbi:hypothetical protein [Paenibacillus sp. RC334]|uniref:hypothetical protein n=1 Tax=Paenibacillus sp. RC334 TaxID=3045840 RepID=UPI0024BB6388|nr:hypothetical protein [Paenibacillus sp. RC334]
MKNIKKASLLSVLSLAVAIPLTASAAATTDVNAPKVGDHVITPQATNKVLAKSLGNTDMSERFYIDPGYGYARVFVSNDGSAPINITVTQDQLVVQLR